MSRLTKDIREKISAGVLRHRFSEPLANLIADRAAFAEEVYNDLYRKADRDKIEALPRGWFHEADQLEVRMEGVSSYERLTFNGGIWGNFNRIMDRPENVLRRIVYKHVSGCAKVYPESHKLTKKFAAIKDRQAQFVRDFEAAERQISAALSGVSTIKRLIETWPEVEPFAKPFLNAPNNLPAIPTEKLNELLDLPVSEAA